MTLVVPFEDIFKEDTKLLAKHESWERVELGEVCEVLNGFAFKSTLFNKTQGFPVVRIRDLMRGRTETFYKGDYPKEYVVENGDLLVGMDGNFGCYEWRGGEALLNQRVCKLIPREDYLHRKFLLFGINGYLKAIQEATSSVTVGHLSSRDIQRIPLPFPSLNEQRRIVEKLEKLLSRVDAAQARLATIPRTLKRFRQSVLSAACSGRLTADWRDKSTNNLSVQTTVDSLFERRVSEAETTPKEHKIRSIYEYEEEGDSDTLPEAWEFVALDKLSESFNYGTSSKSQTSGLVPVLRMGNIQNGEVDWSDLVYTSDEDEIAKYILEPKTVLFNRTNSPELVGKTAIYRGEQPAIFAGYLIRINNFGVLDSAYLNYCLNSTYARDFCLSTKTDGVSQSNINAQKLGKFEVPFCSLLEQQEIVRRVETLFKTADALEARYQKAKAHVDKLTQSILAKAFRGELVPQDPNDEPASVLLARIRAQFDSEESRQPAKRKGKRALTTDERLKPAAPQRTT